MHPQEGAKVFSRPFLFFSRRIVVWLLSVRPRQSPSPFLSGQVALLFTRSNTPPVIHRMPRCIGIRLIFQAEHHGLEELQDGGEGLASITGPWKRRRLFSLDSMGSLQDREPCCPCVLCWKIRVGKPCERRSSESAIIFIKERRSRSPPGERKETCPWG